MNVLISLLMLSQVSFAAVNTLSLDDVMAKYTDTLEVTPVRLNGLPVSAQPSEICVMAGYQFALESETGWLMAGEKYVQVNGTGWGRASSVSGFDFETKKSDGIQVLVRVLCKKKLPI